MASQTPENAVKSQIKKYLTTLNNVVLVSNPSGKAWVGAPSYPGPSTVMLKFPRRVDFGCFAPGAPDMLGFKTIIITKDMVGQKFARFVALEIKRPDGGRITADQADVIQMINDRGGKAAVVSSSEDVEVLFSGD